MHDIRAIRENPDAFDAALGESPHVLERRLLASVRSCHSHVAALRKPPANEALNAAVARASGNPFSTTVDAAIEALPPSARFKYTRRGDENFHWKEALVQTHSSSSFFFAGRADTFFFELLRIGKQ